MFYIFTFFSFLNTNTLFVIFTGSCILGLNAEGVWIFVIGCEFLSAEWIGENLSFLSVLMLLKLLLLSPNRVFLSSWDNIFLIGIIFNPFFLCFILKGDFEYIVQARLAVPKDAPLILLFWRLSFDLIDEWTLMSSIFDLFNILLAACSCTTSRSSFDFSPSSI